MQQNIGQNCRCLPWGHGCRRRVLLEPPVMLTFGGALEIFEFKRKVILHTTWLSFICPAACVTVRRNWLRQKHKVRCELVLHVLKHDIKSLYYCESLSVGLCQCLLHKQRKPCTPDGEWKGQNEYKAKKHLTLTKETFLLFLVPKDWELLVQRSLKGTFKSINNSLVFYR